MFSADFLLVLYIVEKFGPMKRTLTIAALLLCMACGHDGKNMALLDAAAFETEIDGAKTGLYTLRGGDIAMQVTNYGGRVVSLWTPDRNGDYADIEIGYESIGRYLNNSGERFLGAAVGPFANRIAGGRFALDGKTYSLPQNNNGQTLHGGNLGIDRIVWQVESVSDCGITMRCTLPDGQDGFPGNRDIEMSYRLTPDNEFVVTYTATTDAPTVMNLSHHSFFNLHGEGCGTILDHRLTIAASNITPIDERMIPTGEIMPVEGTPFDFRTPHAIGDAVNDDNEQLRCGAGYDHNWIIDREDDKSVMKVADLYDPASGRGFEIWSDQIAMQFYCGNFFDGSHCGKYGRPIEYRSAVVFETQRYPDSPNRPEFPDCTLRPGETYTHVCKYKFYTK